ncbi:MAG TPA: primosomal replication protein N [Pararobbsia sp.]|nr:primosomal replication protein N [Pararobbsia sp.]
MNRLQLDANIVEREPLRYTPAGVPIVNCTLAHRGTTQEAGVARQIEMTLAALAAGEISGRIANLALGEPARFVGFLAPRNRSAKSLVFHITELLEIEED